MLCFNKWRVAGLGVMMVGALLATSAKASTIDVDGSIFQATFPGDAVSTTDWTTRYASGGGSISVADNTLTITGAAGGLAWVDSRDFAIPDPAKYAVKVDFNATVANPAGGNEWELLSLYAGSNGTSGKAGVDLCLYGTNLCWNRNEADVVATIQLGQSYSVIASVSDGKVGIYVDGDLRATKDVIGGTPVCIEMGDGYLSTTGVVQYTNVSVGAAIPEPGTVSMLVAGLFGLLAYAWRRRK